MNSITEKIDRELALSYCLKYLGRISGSKYLQEKENHEWQKIVAKVIIFGAFSEGKNTEALEHVSDKQKLFNKEDKKEIFEVAPFLICELGND